jgi:drug/metabolite transporter (DMT)-like permease
MIQRQHWGWFILVAFLGVYLNQMFFTFGVHYAGAVLASVGQLATPPVTSILAVIFKMEKFSWMRLAGVALSIVGAFVLLGLDQIDLSSDRTIGIVILLVQSLWVASFFLLQKAKLLEQYALHPPTMTLPET